MFTNALSKNKRGARRYLTARCLMTFVLLTGLARLSSAQNLLLATVTPVKAPAVQRSEAQPEASLPLLERLEALEEMAATTASPALKGLFAEGLPCQIHARSEDDAVITEIHPLLPASASPVAAAPAPFPNMTPTTNPVLQEVVAANGAGQAYVSEKIKSLQRMLELVEAKEKLMESRDFYERKLGEFDDKVREQ